ncbi:glycerol-3-phosphate dehydrogenase [Marinobacterium jannaschii]|uniref:glycerol-3-phosphate dehydrogenase n=1 Tax=Marinobacterium jannaschii TaxID=64970 RepID=UPI00055B9A9E|nr:glycerol-3-phosphate dehydrogenase [Marinobacterium jannaschii]
MSQGSSATYDLYVVGGGINGAGIAADAAGRGLAVGLCEMNDLASATSSASSKLIHGGLRYLEQGEFRLVREALGEREVLLRKAPHIIRPMRFRLPHNPKLRSAMVIQAGMLLYDRLARRTTLPASETLNSDSATPLRPEFNKLFEYSDAWVDDARLVVLNAMAARQAGAVISTRTQCISAAREQGLWTIRLRNVAEGNERVVYSRALVNAVGPWVSRFYNHQLKETAPKQVRLVQGSHIVVPRLYSGDEAYILQHSDRRIVFVLPYEGRFSLIGTTDLEHETTPETISITQDEVEYLLMVVNNHFLQQLNKDDVVHSFAGIRPLVCANTGPAQKASRDYEFSLDDDQGEAPLLSVFGGKITTYRKLAEAALNKLSPYFCDMRPAWTADTPLPGGDFSSPAELLESFSQHYPWLPEELKQRYCRSYGTLSQQILLYCQQLSDLGQHFGAGLYQREVEYLIEQEWALTAEDILWRRSKLGLHMSSREIKALQEYLQKRTQACIRELIEAEQQ